MSNYEPPFILIDVVVRPRAGIRVALKRCTTTGVLFAVVQVREQSGWVDSLPPVPLSDLETKADEARQLLDHIERRWISPGTPEQKPLPALFWAIAMPITGFASVLIAQFIQLLLS